MDMFVGGAWTGGGEGAPGLAACSRIWGVYAPDVGTPLCVAAWLIFITAHNDGAREWGLGWKRQGETKGRRVAKEEWVVGVGGAQNKRREARDKGNSEAEKLCFLLIQWQSDGAARYPDHVRKP